MENLPKTEMLAPELKDPEHPFPMTQSNKIKAYIAMHYQNDPSHFNKAFSELDEMRKKMLQGVGEDELICVLKRYYAQLTMMKNRFPMELDGEASIQFNWSERASDNPLPISIPDINFEICCVMFNIGCLHGIIAASQERKDEDSCKTAFMHFQQAAGPFITLRDELNARRCGLADFDDISLTFYANIMLAQAQECILEKSIGERRSSAIIYKIAYRIFQLYNSCGQLISDNPSFADMIPSSRYKNWTRLCSIKGAIYGVIYFYARGQEFSQEQKPGASLACFKAGLDLAIETMPLTNKDKRPTLKEALIYVKEAIEKCEQISRKENDLIYHERIPSISELEEIKGVDMVKAIHFEATDPSTYGEDLFKELLPSSVVEIVSLYEEAKAELRRSVLNKCDKMDAELESYLLTLKLDKLNLDQPYDIQRLPDELVVCYSEFNSQPDCVHNLLEKFHELSTKTTTVECQLADMADRMTSVRTPQFAGSEGYKAISKELSKLTEQHKQARSNNAELQKRLDMHTDNLKLFAMSLPELTNEVSGKVIDTTKSPEGQELRRLLNKVEEMGKQRVKLIADLRVALDKDDITPQALVDPYSDPKPIIRNQLKRHDKLIEIIDQNLAAQKNILNALTDANANFADFRRQIIDTIESKKSKAITLVTAFETFKQIRSNTEKAIQFYDNMLKLLARINEGVRNMEQAKKQEDEEQRILMEKEQAKRQSVEVAEFVNEFASPPSHQSSRSGSYAQTPTNYSPVNQPMPTNPGRPTLGDFLRNRNKAPNGISPTPMQNDNQQVATSAYQPPISQQQMVNPHPISQHQMVNPQPISQHQMVNPQPISQHQMINNPHPISQHQTINNPQPISQHQMINNPQPISQHQMIPSNQQFVNPPQQNYQVPISQNVANPQIPQSNYQSNYQVPISQPQIPQSVYQQPTSLANYQPTISQIPHSNYQPTFNQSVANPQIPPQSTYQMPISQPTYQQPASLANYQPTPQTTYQMPISQPQVQQPISQPTFNQNSSIPQPTYQQPTSLANYQPQLSQFNVPQQQYNQAPIMSTSQQNNVSSTGQPTSNYSSINQAQIQPTPLNGYQNGFNGTSTNGTNSSASVNKSAQNELEDLFGGVQTPKPQQTNQQSNQVPPMVQNPQVPPHSSPYMQQQSGAPASPWHTSSINPLLMKRKY